MGGLLSGENLWQNQELRIWTGNAKKDKISLSGGF
ncbi:hypothetical protein SPLC1_S570070 [Arthrospira platensis C1]|nr:hypothetical protein SPLC1_S570070 [Arthrospira platensis C1]